jgi:hypothetical protein
LVYPEGSDNDAPNHTVGGKRTWYSARNDLLNLLNLADKPPETPPSVAGAKAKLDTLDDKTQHLSSSGTLPTSRLSGNVSSSNVSVSGWSSLADYASLNMGKVVSRGRSSDPDVIILPAGGGSRAVLFPPSTMKAMTFDGSGGVSHDSSTGGLRFAKSGWFSFVVSFQMRANTEQYMLTPFIAGSDGAPAVFGETFSNPSYGSALAPVVQCSGLVHAPSNTVYLPGCAISCPNGFAGAIKMWGGAASDGFFMSAVEMK